LKRIITGIANGVFRIYLLLSQQ